MPVPALTIRPATLAEQPALAALWAETGLTTSYNDPRLDFLRASNQPGSDVLVGLVADAVVASVMVGHDGHRGWLYYVAVAPAWQGHGFGAALVAAGEEWLRARGIPKVQLMVRATNQHVLAFYAHLAYEPSSVKVMQKWLIPPARDSSSRPAIAAPVADAFALRARPGGPSDPRDSISLPENDRR